MRQRRLIWHILPYYFLIIIIALVAVSWYASRSVKMFYVGEKEKELEERAKLVSHQLVSSGAALEGEETVDALCDTLGVLSGTRITVILPDGRVLGDSEEDPGEMKNHSDRPEIIAALRGEAGSALRYSDTLDHDLLYVAIPLFVEGELRAVIRTAVPLYALEESLGWMYGRILGAGMVVAILTVLVGAIVSRRITKPLEVIRRGAERLADDDLDYRLPRQGLLETDTLSTVMNEMAGRLAVRIENARRQRVEQEAIFSSMNEGLLVVDTDERVIKMNPVAREIFKVGSENVIGRTIQEVVRNYDVQQLAAQLFVGKEAKEIEINFEGNRFFSVSGAPLLGEQGENQGAVIVFRDISRLKKLEIIRRDFVANVSHELRTPITTIKGFAETLLDEGCENAEKANRFLRIMSRHADRMNTIIEDLLTLSRFEQTRNGAGRFERLRIEDVLDETLDFCLTSREERDIEIITEFPEELHVKAVPVLLSQAIANLLDNAIKNSEQGGKVRIAVTEGEGEVYIDVADDGRGIEKEHLQRIFERFYRVDKSRSRREGGTGLGLAIVKHIVQMHGGNVSVESEPGRGSTFRITIPKARD